MLDQLYQSLDKGWSLGSDAFDHICSLAASRAYQSLIEFGSGQSTIAWACALPNVAVTSFEHDRIFCEETKKLLLQHDLTDRVKVHYAPLRTVWVDGRPFQSYARPKMLSQADMVIIDGPPAFTRRGREACLYHVYDCLRVGGMVVLDDADRPDEQQTVINWMTVYPGSFQLEQVAVGHGLAILRKICHVPRNRTAIEPLRDSFTVLAEKLTFGIKRAVAIHLLLRADPADSQEY